MFLCLQVPTNPIAHQVFCVFVSVCLSFVYHSGNGDPPAIALILIKVFCVAKSGCVFFLCMLCLITKGVVVDSVFLLLQLGSGCCSGFLKLQQKYRELTAGF